MARGKKKQWLPKFVRERQHSKAMAWRRYRVKLNRAGYLELVNQIKEGRSKFVSVLSNTRALHVVKAFNIEGEEVEMTAIYDTKRRELVTVLAPDMEVYGYATKDSDSNRE